MESPDTTYSSVYYLYSALGFGSGGTLDDSCSYRPAQTVTVGCETTDIPFRFLCRDTMRFEEYAPLCARFFHHRDSNTPFFVFGKIPECDYE
jgi:hypothetical protein